MADEIPQTDLNALVVLLKEVAKWTRLQGIHRARELLLEVLKRDSEKVAYENSDGRGSAEVGKVAGVSDFAVRSYWKKWAALGLVVPSEKYKGRFERLFSLSELGFEVPPPRGEAGKSDLAPSETGGGLGPDAER